MKVKLVYSILLAAVVFSASTQAQDGPNVVRSRLCNVNPGYSMSEVVEFARNIEWPEEYTPSAMFFREARAVPGDFQRDWDFVWSSFFLTGRINTRQLVRKTTGQEVELVIHDSEI